MSKLIYPGPGQVAVADREAVIEASNKILSDAYHGRLKKHSERVYPLSAISEPEDYYYYNVNEVDSYTTDLENIIHELQRIDRNWQAYVEKLQKEITELREIADAAKHPQGDKYYILHKDVFTELVSAKEEIKALKKIMDFDGWEKIAMKDKK